MSADFSLVLVGTNILLAATVRSRKHHVAAVGLLIQDERKLAITPQIVREYVADANVVAVALAHADGTTLGRSLSNVVPRAGYGPRMARHCDAGV